MELYEIHIKNADEETIDVDAYLELLEEINAIVEDNLELLSEKEESRTRRFHYNAGKLAMYDRRWGVRYDTVDDMRAISSLHPTFTFELIRTWSITSTTAISNLENFWKGVFQFGEMTDAFKAEPIVWVSESASNWFV
jgi:hypothetical protein